MTDVLYFEKDGFTYAKGFFNQNGWSFYVLTGFMEEFEKKLPLCVQEKKSCYVEELSELPGGTRCPPEVPA